MEIEIVDTGIGMDDEARLSLFTKFGTNLTGSNMNSNGLGLGLYLSKEICQKLGGDIA
jgi:signal transduction histidine kinase